jgi:hypothetical protein
MGPPIASNFGPVSLVLLGTPFSVTVTGTAGRLWILTPPFSSASGLCSVHAVA